MKKYLLIIIWATLVGSINAQFVKNKKKDAAINWQNLAIESDGVYGAEVEKAYQFFDNKKPKKVVTVALIGAGIDLEHEDLKNRIWINRKEKANHKDDDKNGLIDDLHGWNYLGTPDGKTLNKISREGDREFFRLKEKEYSQILNVGNRYYMYDREQKKRVTVAPPANLNEYLYYRTRILPESTVAGTYSGIYAAEIFRSYLPQFDEELRAMYPEKEITSDEVNQYASTKAKELEKDTLQTIAFFNVNLGFLSASSNKWNDVLTFFREKHPAHVQANYEKVLANTIKNDRKAIGDNPYDIHDTAYGNNNLMADNAGIGTLHAGIIAAARHNDTGINGIAEKVQIMTLRIEADRLGEPYLKDMALAIRYAVDHGADIIQMGKSNTLFPIDQSDWVKEALLYAESKGVLIVMPMVDLAYNLEEKPFYPNRYIDKSQTLNNMITVAASNQAGNPLLDANYSNVELDLFAPGGDVISLYTGNTVRSFSSSSMAASVVTGIAALIKSHYPKINGAQIRQVLMETVTSRAGEEVEKNSMLITPNSEKKIKDLFLFEDLCVSGGIVNAYNAIQAVDKMYNNK